jgi:hypothetical protein
VKLEIGLGPVCAQTAVEPAMSFWSETMRLLHLRQILPTVMTSWRKDGGRGGGGRRRQKEKELHLS